MEDKGWVIITLRKEVPDRDRAREIYDMIKVKLADRPDIQMTGHFSNHFDLKGDDE